MEILASIITGVLALIGVVITVLSGQKKTDLKLDKQQAIMDTKLTELTREVREHNEFARRIPILETKIEMQDERIKALEKKGG